jgi:uncharacterized protein (TIGR03435 family)
MVKARLVGAVGIVAVAGAVLTAQTPVSPAFESASIKPNTSSDQTSSSVVQPGGRYSATNATLRMLVQTAYGVHDDQIVGGPTWTHSARFDVVAKAEGNASTGVFIDRARLMLRQMLADRFRLTLHHETRDLPIYALVVARRDGRLGPQLRPSDAVECTAAEALNPRAPAPTGDPDVRLPCGGGFSRQGHMAARASMFVMFVTGLSNWSDRLVFDRTALAGSFDWDLQWSAERLSADTPNAASDRSSDAGLSLFTALQEQLGLKLESTTGPVDALVIDHVERPTED